MNHTQRRLDAIYAWAMHHAPLHSLLLRMLAESIYITHDCNMPQLHARQLSPPPEHTGWSKERFNAWSNQEKLYSKIAKGSDVVSWLLISEEHREGVLIQRWQMCERHRDAIWCALQDYEGRKEHD